MRVPRFIVFQRVDELWTWHLRAANGEILCSAEGFASKRNAIRAATGARAAARMSEPEIIERDGG